MPRVSGFKRLPPEVRDMIGSLREQGKTIDDIMDALKALGRDVPRSTVGDWTKKIDAVAAKMEQSRVMADALVRRFGDEPDSKTARLNMQMMHTVLYEALGHVLSGGDAGELTPKQAMELAKALDHLTRAAKTDAEFIAKVRAEARKEAEERMEAAVQNAAGEAKDKAMTPLQALERVKAIYRGEA